MLFLLAACARSKSRDESHPPPKDAAPSANVARREPLLSTLALGGHHTCVLDKAKVLCWGENASGQVGDGTTITRTTATEVPGLTDVLEIAAADDVTCARTSDGTIRCWGEDPFFKVKSTTPAKLSLPAAERMRLSKLAICIRTKDDKVWCSGDSFIRATDEPGPAEISMVGKVVDFAFAGAAACALLVDGTLACWGDARDGRIPRSPDKHFVRTPVDAGLSRIDRLAGSAHGTFCAHGVSGTVCWGESFDLQSFAGSSPSGDSWLEPRPVPSLDGFDAFGFVGGTTCAWTEKRLVCDRRGLRTEPKLESIAEVALGGLHTCARTKAGDVLCWGDNDAGQLGDGTRKAHLEPARVQLHGLVPSAKPEVQQKGVSTTATSRTTRWEYQDAKGATVKWASDLVVHSLKSTGSIATKDGNALVEAGLAALDACYVDILLSDRGAKGMLVLTLDVDAKGAVTKVSRVSGTMAFDGKPSTAPVRGDPLYDCARPELLKLTTASGPGVLQVSVYMQAEY